jgi:hypothetical protein
VTFKGRLGTTAGCQPHLVASGWEVWWARGGRWEVGEEEVWPMKVSDTALFK